MSGNREDRTEYKHIKLNREIFEKLSSVKFGFLRLGPLCNASESNAFTSARCNHSDIKDDSNRKYVIFFKDLFPLAITLLEELKDNRTPDDSNIAAIKKLELFMTEKDKHETSLRKILLEKTTGKRKKEKYTETKMTATLAEHLFKLLAPGKHYLIDKNIREKKSCLCACGSCTEKPKLGSTNIGHGKVWHGSIDIVLSSNPADSSSSGARGDEDHSDNDAAFSLKGRNIIEVKRTSLSGSHVCNQAIAETITFSFFQKKEHQHIWISPNILISPKEFRIIMYDAENDILICSQPLELFTRCTNRKRRNLDVSSIIILWIVLHYEKFLKQENSPFTEPGFNKKKYQSNFRKIPNIESYRSQLQFGVESFQREIVKETFPDNKSLSDGVNVLQNED